MSYRFADRRLAGLDRCEHCGDAVTRVWLVPGDSLNSCRRCYVAATGRQPVHDQGHSTPDVAGSVTRSNAPFYVRVDGRRPAGH